MITKHLGFTGTRGGMTLPQVRRLQSWRATLLAQYTDLHEGDCIGADEKMVDIFKDLMTIVCHPPIDDSKRAFAYYDEIREPKEYIARNHDIVNESVMLIATPKGYHDLLRSGTWATIRHAARTNKRAVIIWPDGTWDTKGGD